MSIFNNIWVKKIPIYAGFSYMTYRGFPALFPSFDGPVIIRICGILCVLCFGLTGLLMLFHDIRLSIMKRQDVGCDHKGIYIRKTFIPWERIQGFKISRDELIYKTIHVMVKDQAEEIQATSNPFTRLCYKITAKAHGTIYSIDPEDFNGSAESFVAYLEGEKKRYGKE